MADPNVTGGGLVSVATQQPAAGTINATQANVSTPPPTPAVGYTAPQAAASTANATPLTVSPNATVAGNLRDIIAEDSPLMQQADLLARQNANARGLLDSSIAEGARQQALIETALPIAQQDAQQRFQAAASTQQAQNTAALNNSQLNTQTSQQNAGLVATALGQNAQAANAQALAFLDRNSQLQMAQLSSDTQKQLQTLTTQNQQLLQENSSAATMFANVVTQLGAIAQNATLSPDAKNQATATQINMLNQGLQQLSKVGGTTPNEISQLNLSQFFTPEQMGTTPVTQTPVSGLANGNVGGLASGSTVDPNTVMPSTYGNWATIAGQSVNFQNGNWVVQ